MTVRDAIIAEAMRWAGTPYRHQGAKLGVGCDCLGLVRGIWVAVYGGEPEDPGAYAMDWAGSGDNDRLLDAARRHCRERPRSAAAAGDLLVFRWRRHLPSCHLGILLPDYRFIHAYQGHGVVTSPLACWRGRIAGVFSFPDK